MVKITLRNMHSAESTVVRTTSISLTLTYTFYFYKKTAVLTTLVTMTIVSDVENSKNLCIIVTCKFPITSLQCQHITTL